MLDYFPLDVKKPGRTQVDALDAKESITMDLSKNFVMFNGNNAHGVRPFSGDRFSLVFFTTSNFQKVDEKNMSKLKSLGFKVPSLKTMGRVKEISKKEDESR